jgi:chromosome segregation ATPase
VAIVWILIVLILAGGLSTAAILFSVRVFSQQSSKSFGKDRDILKAESAKFDGIIERAAEYTRTMISLDEVKTIEAKKTQVLQVVAEERSRVKRVEQDLEQLQVKVDKQEAKHNELKKGKEDAERLADDIKANKERLLSEAKKLQDELQQSKSQMETILSEVDLNEEQISALKDITTSIEKMGAQMKELADIHTQSSGRFVNLQKQFSELEKEFRKLVDKELSGGE